MLILQNVVFLFEIVCPGLPVVVESKPYITQYINPMKLKKISSVSRHIWSDDTRPISVTEQKGRKRSNVYRSSQPHQWKCDILALIWIKSANTKLLVFII